VSAINSKQTKKAIVLGASSGIGKALAIRLVHEGYRVGIASRRGYLLKEIRGKAPESIIYRQINVTQREKAIARIHEMIQELGGLDLFVFSSGTGFINESLDWNKERAAILTNVEGFTAIVTAMYKYFQKRGYGHIAGISSVAGIRGSRYAPAYNASKAYQINLLESLQAKSFKERHNIHITDIRPGFVDTAMAGGDKLFWVASPEKAAKQIFAAVKSKKRVAYVTRRWWLVAFIIKIIPGWVLRRI
jgi:short-subunit dehydrogenase